MRRMSENVRDTGLMYSLIWKVVLRDCKKAHTLGLELSVPLLYFVQGGVLKPGFGFPAFSGIARLTWLVELFGELSAAAATMEEDSVNNYSKMTAKLVTRDNRWEGINRICLHIIPKVWGQNTFAFVSDVILFYDNINSLSENFQFVLLHALSCMDSTSYCKTRWIMLPSMIWRWSQSFSWCHSLLGLLSLHMSPLMLNGVEVRWLWRTVRTRSSLVFSSCVKALRCLGSLSCCSINPSPPRSNQRVEHVSEERVVLLCRSLKTAPDMNLPAPCFSVDSNTVVSFCLLFVSLHTPLCYWH